MPFSAARFVTLVCWLSVAAAAAGRRQKVIINSDPGIDDSMAILLALASEELEVLGITVNTGSLHNTTLLAENALRVCELAGRPDVPVFLGAAEPLAMEFHNYGGANFHGEDGLGDNHFAPPKGRINRSMGAVEFLVSTVRSYPGDVVIISLAPVTNLALALRMDPSFAPRVKHVYMMGGSIAESGNVSPVSEANIVNDAPAAKVLFASGVPLTLASLDVTMHTRWTREYMRELGSVNEAGRFISRIMEFYFAAYDRIGFPYAPSHDPSAVMALLEPSLYEARRYPLDVVVAQTADEWHGMVLADRRGGPLAPTPPGFEHFPFVLVSVNETAFRQRFHERIARLPARPAHLVYA